MRCKLSTINGWCGIFNKPCKECISPTCEFIKKAYRQGRVEAEYFTSYKEDWIPVSDDTLPDKDIDVNVTIKDFAETRTGYLAEENWWLITKEGMLEHYPLEYVIAWQPLPEPYKGGDNNG